MEVKRFFKVMMPGFTHSLNLPQAVCKNLALQQKMGDAVILKTQLGNWRIQVCKNIVEAEDGFISFQNGWPDFVRTHQLNVGDFVVFEHTQDFKFKAILLDSSGCEKDYLLTQISDDNDEHPPKLNIKRKKEVEGLTFESKNPFFTLTMRPSHAHRCKAWIPREFWNSNYINDKKLLVVREGTTGGKEWRIDMRVAKQNHVLACRLGKGWMEFYGDNKLKNGDVCVFELRKDVVGRSEDDAVMDLHIYPVRKSVNKNPSNLNLKRKHSEINKGGDITFQSQNPFFVLTVKPSHVQGPNALIPQAFWESKYINDKKRLVVRDVGGGNKDWRIDLRARIMKGVLHCRLGRGWSEFYGDNNLKDGDACVFELRQDEEVGRSKDEAVMDVHIYPV